MRRLALIGLLLASAVAAGADGKLFGRGHTPPISYQRAFVQFADGRELLILQAQFADVPTDLAWVIPCPAAPVLGTLSADGPFPALARATTPRIVRLGWMVETALFSVISIMLVLRGIRASRERRRALPYLASALLVVALWAMLESPGWRRTPRTTDLVPARPAGLTGTRVFDAKEAEALLKWLVEGGFTPTADDRRTIEAYATRGWCFATARVRVGEKSAAPGPSDRITDPLVLSFATPQAVYPLALGATTGAPTEVLLYAASATRTETDARFAVEYAGGDAAHLDWEAVFAKADPPDLRARIGGALPSAPRVTKLRARLQPGDMAEDATLAPAAADEDFRKRVFRW